MSLRKEWLVEAKGGIQVTHDSIGTEYDNVLTWKEIDDDAESEPHVGKCKPSENKGEDIVLNNILAGEIENRKMLDIQDLGDGRRTCE